MVYCITGSRRGEESIEVTFILIGLGGAAGSMARFALGNFITSRSKSDFPFGTFLINIIGAFLLGIAVSAGLGTSLSLLVAQGFLGAFTTFSTFMFESFTLIENKRLNRAVLYIAASILLGVLSFSMGYYAVGLLPGRKY